MSASDPAQPDLAWRGYSGWAMLPSFGVCILLSAVLLAGGYVFEDIRGVGREVGWWVLFELTLAIWIVQLLRWLYRGASYVYRLTPSHLYLDRGLLYRPVPPIDLTTVVRIVWGTDLFGRFLGVGWVRVEIEARGAQTLTGLLRPAAFAEEIEAAMRKAKGEDKLK